MHEFAGHTVLLNPAYGKITCQLIIWFVRGLVYIIIFMPNLISVQFPCNHGVHSTCGVELSLESCHSSHHVH